MKLPVRLVSGGWPRPVERVLSRFVWSDPRVIADPDVSPQEFVEAMKAIHVGETYKITGSDRHGPADELLLAHGVDSDARIADVGASDGSTSVDLISRLPDFATFTISDKYLSVNSATVGSATVFADPSTDRPILVVDSRFIAWPELSKPVAAIFSPITKRAARRSQVGVPLLNPRATEVLRTDPRVRVEAHDVFEPWPEPRPTIIKVANLLRRLYFSDADLDRALRAVHASLDDGGLFLLVDNPRIAGIAIRAGLFKRTAAGFSLVSTTRDEPEIMDLMSSFRTPATG